MRNESGKIINYFHSSSSDETHEGFSTVILLETSVLFIRYKRSRVSVVKMLYIENMVKDIAGADNWLDLERVFLEEQKYGLLPVIREHRYCRYEFTGFIGAVYGSVNPRVDVETVDVPLPALVVNVDNVKYFIHGIVHDEAHESIVQEALLNMDDVVCETALKGRYSLVESSAQPRLDEIRFCRIRDWYLNYFPFMKSHSHNDSNISKSQVTISDVLREQTFSFRNGLFDLRQANYPEHLEENMLDYKLGERFSRLLLLRSLSQAEFIRKFAQERDTQEVHGLYGLYHQGDIAYFLSHAKKKEELVETLKFRSKFSELGHVSLPFISLGAIGAPFYFAQALSPWCLLGLPAAALFYWLLVLSSKTSLER